MRRLPVVQDPAKAGLRCFICGGTAVKGSVYYECDGEKVTVIEEDGKEPTVEREPCKATTCDADGCLAGHQAVHAKEREIVEARIPPHLR